jgi:hypothetical protein
MAKKDFDGLIEKELQEIQSDVVEYIESSIEHNLSIAKSRDTKVKKVPLLLLLDEFPNGDFSVTDTSLFSDERWNSSTMKAMEYTDFIMSNPLNGGEFFAKCLSYYLLPGNNPYGKVNSWSSTYTYVRGWIVAIEDYLFKPNGLDATPESIKAISSRMIIQALDQAQLSKAKRHYEFLFYGVVFWLSLSKDGYLPKGIALSGVSLEKVDTKKRRQSVGQNALRYVNGWKPLSEPELASLLSYAVDWIEIGLPSLESIQGELIKAEVWDKRTIYINGEAQLNKYKLLFSSKVNGGEVVQTSYYSHENKRPGIRDNGYQINWRHGFRLALNEVKNSLLVSIGLITGMRIRELSELMYDDFTYNEDSDKWFLDITRFKTTDDPNYGGETETIEIPHFYGENVQRYKSLRDSIVDDGSEVLFDNNLSRSANKVKRSINKVFKSLGERLGIDDLHPHRLRKTIAEILIKRSEKNIDIIRMLFGHHSFTMSLRYISRNPFMIGSVAVALETHHANNFNEIVEAVMKGEASGPVAKQLEVNFVNEKSKVFKGKLIRMKVFEYIIYLLQSGVPLHIERTTLGSFCVLANEIDPQKIPPCIQGRDSIENLVPDISNCDVSCEHAVVLKHSVESLKKDIQFYETILENSINELSAKSKREIIRKIESNKNHLSEFSPDEEYRVVNKA